MKSILSERFKVNVSFLHIFPFCIFPCKYCISVAFSINHLVITIAYHFLRLLKVYTCIYEQIYTRMDKSSNFF